MYQDSSISRLTGKGKITNDISLCANCTSKNLIIEKKKKTNKKKQTPTTLFVSCKYVTGNKNWGPAYARTQCGYQ